MKLTNEQTNQLKKQVKNHNHQRYKTNIKLQDDARGKCTYYDFIIESDVMRPEIMTSSLVAQWLYKNLEQYEGQNILDIGCGTGLLGIVTAMAAKNVKLSDISLDAVINTAENLKKFDHRDRCRVLQSDLFSDVKGEFDLIIFNQPYFPITVDEAYSIDNEWVYQKGVLTSMCGGEKLIHDFFEQSKNHLSPSGRLLMSFFHILPDTNDPAVQGPKHGYKVDTVLQYKQQDGLQQGEKSIYLLTLNP